MADQLGIYNGALLICGERFLGSLTEERGPRRLLDHVWNTGGVRACLEEGQWHFATRTTRIAYDQAVTPQFGYARAFSKPTDWVLTCAVCSDEYFRSPLVRYADEIDYWFADLDTIYVSYVSDDSEFGNNLARWPEAFREFVQAHFASRIILKLSNSVDELKKVEAIREDFLTRAKNKNAMQGPTVFPARGSWGLARNRNVSRRDGGGFSGNLIG